LHLPNKIEDLNALNFITRNGEGTETGDLGLFNINTKESLGIKLKTVSTTEIETVKIEQIKGGIGIGLIEKVSLYEKDTNNLVELLPDYQSNITYETLILTKKNPLEIRQFITKQIKKVVEKNIETFGSA